MTGMDLRYGQLKIVLVIFDQVPGIGLEFVFHVGMEPGRSEQGDMAVPAQTDAQQMVKTDEMIHMGVRNKDIPDFESYEEKWSSISDFLDKGNA